MILYHHIEPDNYSDYGVTANPTLPDDVSFIDGAVIDQTLDRPLVFEVNYPAEEQPSHFIGDRIPVFSSVLVDTLRAAGVDNLQTFPALLRNEETGKEWSGYWAVNVLGLVACANLKESEYETLMEGDSEGVNVPLLGFQTIVLAKKKVPELLMFRLGESPATMLIHDRINTYIDEHDPPDGWGFDATEIDVR